MANWKKYTNPHLEGEFGYVNMDLVVQAITHKDYCRVKNDYTGKVVTRLFTGQIAMAGDGMGGVSYDCFTIDAAEPIEYFVTADSNPDSSQKNEGGE